ncbi:MAG: Trk system potassium transporter TrkA [Christensenellaceae bacterium]|nr:Trk system potassium transporter TrkA [Christensenellaceae bacterium]
MKIVIVGGGKVGHLLSKKLSYEENDVIVIDNDPDVLAKVGNEMDVICVEGNGADHRVLREAGVSTADLLIAATAHDEVNMICCLIAHKLGAKHTIARVRDPKNTAQLDFLKEELGLSMAINPEFAAAEEISRLLRIPSAMDVELFARGRVELVEVRVNADTPLVGLSLIQIYSKYRIKVLICAVQRGSDVIIPKGDFVVAEGDRLHISAAPEEMAKFFRTISSEKRRKVRTAMICGGSRVAFYLAKILERSGIQVKVIENNAARAIELSNELPKALVIRGDTTDQELLMEEGIGNVDAFAALTGMDETNIISGLFAKWQGAGKVVVKVNNESLTSIMPSGALESIVSPKQITANRILSFVRAMSCTPEESNVETVYELVGGRIEALEFIAKGNHPMYGMPLKQLNRYLHKELLLACIVRGGRTIIPGGDDYIQSGDRVVIVTKHKMFNDLADILTENIG